MRISFVHGNVLIDQSKGQGNEPATANMPVTAGTVLRTGKDGLAEIEFENGSTVRMAEETALWFPSMTGTDTGSPVTALNPQSGTIYLDYRRAGGNVLYVRGALRMELLRNYCHLRISLTDSEAVIAVFDGSLTNSAGLNVGKGQTLRVDLKTNAILAATNGIDPAATDRWDRERQKYESAHSRPDVLPLTLAPRTGRAPTDERWADPVWNSMPDMPNMNSGTTVRTPTPPK